MHLLAIDLSSKKKVMASVSVAPNLPGRRPSFQPFQCQVCHSRFTRYENLKRHAALHTRSQDEASLNCDFCPATFSRSDLRQRHVKRKHPEHQAIRPRKRQMLQQERVSNAPPLDARTDMHFVTPEEQGDFDVDRGWQTGLSYDQHQPPKFEAHRDLRSSLSSRNGVPTVFATVQSSKVINVALQDTLGTGLDPLLEATQTKPLQFNTTFSDFGPFSQDSPSR